MPPHEELQDYDNSLPSKGTNQGGRLMPKSVNAALPGPSDSDNGTGSRRRSRSRSRSLSPNRKVWAAIDRLRLDENASRQIRQFQPAIALHMLGQVGTDVRNPSAFVNKMVQRAKEKTDADMAPSESDQVETAIRDIGLDDKASSVLRNLPMEEALHMIGQINKDTRNPSAFIMSISSRTSGGKGRNDGRSGGGSKRGSDVSVARKIEDLARQLELDDKVIDGLQDLHHADALQILDALMRDLANIRNRSAFVVAEIKKKTRAPTPQPAASRRGTSNGVPCKFFAEGRCKNGSTCRFSHA